MPASGPAPTLSQVKVWETEHLTEAATHWTKTGAVWKDAFIHVAAQMPCPGGTPWEGLAAETAQQRAFSDQAKAVALADQLSKAANVARDGADHIQAAKQRVLAAVNAAEAAGFTVGEDFSVIDRQAHDSSAMAARQAQAETFAADIRTRVAELIAVEQQVSVGITTAAFGIGGASFDAQGSGGNGGDPTVQAVDNRTFKQAPPTPEADHRQNQIDAFKKVFGRDPTSASDWETAAALDPHSYDPKNGGAPPNIVVGRIKPIPGQGVVRTNLFIPGEKAWAMGSDNLGDNRGFNPTAGPEQSRVAIYTDYDNGIVVVRQNPSILVNADGSHTVQAGTPSVGVSQNSDGSVRIRYQAADPFSPGGEALAKMSPWNVNGDLAIKPTPSGPIAGGHISDFPAVEIYNDNAGATTELAKIMPQNVTPYGPLAGLPLTQDIGQPDLLKEFPSAASPTPMGRVPPVVVPYPFAQLGPVTNPIQVPIGR